MKHRQHPLSAAYPTMPESELLELAEDIRAHGLHEPVTIFERMVLDGWHRCQACQIAGVEIRYVEYQGEDPREFVIAKNGRRRHLTQSQKAAAAVKVYEWRPAGRPKQPADNSAPGAELPVGDVAKSAGVGERTLRQAAAAERAGLGDAVRDGEMSAKAAAEKVREQSGEPPKPKPLTEVEKLKARIAELEAEVADLKETIDDLTDGLESQEDAKLDEDSAQIKFAQLRERIRVLESQVREHQTRANEFMKEANRYRKRLGLKV